VSVPKIQITLACAYCFAKLNFSQPAITLMTKSGALSRFGKVCELKCPQCSSVFAVELSTKRVRQGAGYKRQVAKQREIHDANVAEAQKRNAEIAEKLLAQPGCTCGVYIGQMELAVPDNYAHRVEQLGHAMDGGVSYGIPTAPHHRYQCPCRNTDEEAAIRGVKGAA
jgi:hypothetical protein